MKTKIFRILGRRITQRKPVSSMSVDNLYAYLDALWHKRQVDGPIVEIGVAYGGTTAFACRFLSRIECKKQYYCVDTFEGFVKDHLETDHKLGLGKNHDSAFSDNTLTEVIKNLKHWGINNNIEFIKADICKAEAEDLPNNISVCLLDVDLRDPIFEGLMLLKNKMADGGIILVDDCKDGTSWVGANIGYRDFIMNQRLETKYYMGFGIIEYNPNEINRVPWQFSSRPNKIPTNFYL